MRELISGLGEFIVLSFFVIAVASVFSACAKILGRGFRDGWKKSIISNRFDCLVIFLGILGVVCIGYGFTEPFQLETTHLTIPSKKMCSGSHLKLALISDLHCDGVSRVEKRLISTIAEQMPDLILFAGDAADGEGLQQFKQSMTAMGKIAPVFAVDGNHDSGSDVSPFNRYAGTGAQLLNCSGKILEVRENRIWVGGIDVNNEPCMVKTMQSAPHDLFSIFLYHFPEGVKEASANQIDLYCAGHTHGGQIRMPWYGALVTMAASGKTYEWGFYKVGNTSMYVNRGIGMTGLPVRFLCPPELTIIEIIGEAKEGKPL